MISKAKFIDPSCCDVGSLIRFIILTTSLITAMKIDPDGGYKDLVIRIASDGSVPENDCPKILYNLKVRVLYPKHSFKQRLIF